MLNRPLPISDFKKGNFFKTNLTLNSAANIAIPNALKYYNNGYIIKTGENIKKNLRDVRASSTTKANDSADRATTSNLHNKRGTR